MNKTAISLAASAFLAVFLITYFAGQPGIPMKDTSRVGHPDSGHPATLMVEVGPGKGDRQNSTTLYKTNRPMPKEISESLASAKVDEARKEWLKNKLKATAAAGVAPGGEASGAVEPCELPGRVRGKDGACYRPERLPKP